MSNPSLEFLLIANSLRVDEGTFLLETEGIGARGGMVYRSHVDAMYTTWKVSA